MSEHVHPLERIADGYAPGEDFPLGGYLGAMGVYSASVGTLAVLARVTKRTVEPPSPWDVVVGAAATHTLSRIVSRDPVTSPLRAPFTRFEGTAGPAELKEEVRGEGARRTLGEMLTCPFCTGMWVATALSAGYVFAPRATRLAAAGLASLAGSDFLQFARAKLNG
ncbi:DUF1360 domain-containing protein [Actinospica sp. MGRD01-02]|uniref:DUF1360 domain-containing protein n=1 Tax=Actinospica acidithermotolerans TaxID=2828514 RepID=A0A941IKE3_9ACTN|nr:DUF1360 domain-containing protein [Actinospica acidithermotolerans]MBR7828028.1 DUF1360 domain-containing protein [Actinospica acidithermotolerans]